MASEDDGRAAIERELADKLREHRDFFANITRGQNRQDGAARPVSHASAATFDSGIVPDVPSSHREASNDQSTEDEENVAIGTATSSHRSVQQHQTVDLDNQNAEEQQLEPDVRGSSTCHGRSFGVLLQSWSNELNVL